MPEIEQVILKETDLQQTFQKKSVIHSRRNCYAKTEGGQWK
jgi:hypothetical protein